MSFLSLSDLPLVNAVLNGSSAILLSLGYLSIRSRRVTAHKSCMLAAVAVSGLFLISYLTYHYNIGSKPFAGEGWIRLLYFAILIPHTILAASLVPLVLITLARALRGQFPRHAKLARITLPIWLYVSVTGVIVYLMLYQIYGYR